MADNIMVFDSEDFDIAYSQDGTVFTSLDGVTGFNINSDPGTSRTVRTLKGSTNVEQQPGPGQASIDIGSFLPHLQSWKDFRGHFSAGRILTFRTQSREEQELLGDDATRMVALAATGLATFSGSGVIDYEEEYAVGHVITVGGTEYVVEKINSGTEVEVSPKPAAAVAVAQFSIKIPRIQRDVTGKILDMNTDNLSEGSQLANAVVISLRSLPGDWSVV